MLSLLFIAFAFPSVASFTIQLALMNKTQNQRPASTTCGGTTILMSSSSSSPVENNQEASSLSGKTLLSIPECLEAYHLNKSDNSEFRSVFIDASWWHKHEEPNAGRKLFEQGPRIPQSKHIDMDDICLASTPDVNPKNLPHMLPTKELFAAAMDHYGIKNDDHIIITARDSVYFTPRTWFLLKTFGHDPRKLHLMQGSLEEWIEAGGEVDSKPAVVPVFQQIMTMTRIIDNTNTCATRPQTIDKQIKDKYKARDPVNVCDLKHVMETLQRNDCGGTGGVGDTLILDSRGSSFATKGRMPGAIHLPYEKWVEPGNTQKWKSVEELNEIFKEAGVDPTTDRNIICSCGSGVSVCHTLLALELCGRDLVLLDPSKTLMYDGSWAEYGKESDTIKIL